jgi:hypothetical protein
MTNLVHMASFLNQVGTMVQGQVSTKRRSRMSGKSVRLARRVGRERASKYSENNKN